VASEQISGASPATIPPAKAPKGFGQIARRISAWTTNSLISVMLLVVALGFGREVLHWWHDGETSPPAAPPDPLADAAAPHILEFGEQAWSIRRQEFSGPSGDLPAALQAACRAVIVASRPRSEAADAAEQELLKRLAAERPVAEEHGQWRIYRWGEGLPVLIGTRAFGVEGQNATRKTRLDEGSSVKDHPADAGTSLDKTPYRVVLWGIAVPAATNAWTLYLFQSGGAAGGAGQETSEIPLPPGGHRLVSIRAAAGGAITAFSADDGDAGQLFYQRWFADHGWTVVDRWQQVASGWHARFEERSSVPPVAVDIRLRVDSHGRWTGLVMESQGPATK
jgi:hypothetical protein